MCLIALAWHCHQRYRLVFAGNRDEFYARPTAPAAWWPSPPQGGPRMLAGRDLQAGGTWLGLAADGRFATVTNVREADARRSGDRSRGELVTALLQSPERTPQPAAALSAVADEGAEYAHFNLLFGRLGEPAALAYVNNVDGVPRALESGYHMLSNHRLNTAWPKAVRVRDGLRALLETTLAHDEEALADALMALLRDPATAPDAALPRTGLALEHERALSAPFIRADGYGTRSSTVVLAGHDGRVRFIEQTFDDHGEPGGRVDECLQLSNA